MANRNTLHISKLEAFKNWLIKDGWEILPLSKNPYEVLRASKLGISNPLIVYSGKIKEHLSFANEWLPVVEAFLHKKTNADRIRSMTDEELAAFCCKVKADYQWADHEFPDEDAFEDWEEWLRAESEE